MFVRNNCGSSDPWHIVKRAVHASISVTLNLEFPLRALTLQLDCFHLKVVTIFSPVDKTYNNTNTNDTILSVLE